MNRRKFFSFMAAAPVAAVVPMPEPSNGGPGPSMRGRADYHLPKGVRFITITASGGGGGGVGFSGCGGGGSLS